MREPSMMSRLGRRFAVMLGGEVLQSVFHFGLNVALVRMLVPHAYGVFAIIFLIGGIALTFVRAVAGVPASIWIPQARGPAAIRAYAVSFGSGATLLSLLLGVGVAGALGLLVEAGTAVAGGFFVGLWCLRSYLRTLMYARTRPLVSGTSDVAFTTSGTLLLAILVLWGEHDLLRGSLVVLAAAHAVGIVVCLVALGEPVRISVRRPVILRYRALAPSLAWSVAGVAISNVQAQGQTLLVALLAGPAAYAPIAATFVLFSPLRLTASVVVNLMQPEMAACLSSGRSDRLRQLMAVSTGLLALACCVYGAFLAATLPLIESRLFAGRFAGEPFGLIAGLVWIVVTTTLLYAAPKTLLETRRSFRELAVVALASAVVGVVLVAALLAVAAPVWSLIGVAASEAVILVYCWRAMVAPAAGQVGAAARTRASDLGRGRAAPRYEPKAG